MTEAATRASWKTEPFGETVRIPYADTFSAEEFKALSCGLIPRAMEDKWFIFFEERVLYLHRSWTGQAVYQVEIQVAPGGYTVTSGRIARSMLKHDDPRYQAEMLKFLVRNLLLGGQLQFPRRPEMSGTDDMIYQHHIAGTGYPVKPVSSRRWWQIWR